MMAELTPVYVLTTDIDGLARPQEVGFDLSAYEWRRDSIFANGFEPWPSRTVSRSLSAAIHRDKARSSPTSRQRNRQKVNLTHFFHLFPDTFSAEKIFFAKSTPMVIVAMGLPLLLAVVSKHHHGPRGRTREKLLFTRCAIPRNRGAITS